MPESVAEHDDWIGSRSAILFGREGAAQRRIHSEGSEVIAGNHLSLKGHRCRLIVSRQAGLEAHGPAGGDQIGEDVLMLAAIQILLPGKSILHVADPAVREPAFQPDYLRRIGNRQRFESDGVVGGKQRGVDADSQGKGDHGNDGETGAPRHRPAGVAQILRRLLEPQDGPFVAMRLFGLFEPANFGYRRAPRSFPSHALVQKVVFQQSEMSCKLSLQILLGMATPQQKPQFRENPPAMGKHQASSASNLSSRPATCCQRCVSSVSAFSPGRVME